MSRRSGPGFPNWRSRTRSTRHNQRCSATEAYKPSRRPALRASAASGAAIATMTAAPSKPAATRKPMSGQVAAHQQRRGGLAIRPFIIALALADLDEAKAGVERQRGGVVPVDFKEDPRGARRGDLRQMRAQKIAADTALAQGGIDSKGENFGLVRRQPRQNETAQLGRRGIERGRAYGAGVGNEAFQFGLAPGVGEAGRVNARAIFRRLRPQRSDRRRRGTAPRKNHLREIMARGARPRRRAQESRRAA